MTRIDLARWYIEEHAAEYEDESEARAAADLLRRVIHRLVATVCCLGFSLSLSLSY